MPSSRCSHCVLPPEAPGVILDAAGICNHCRAHDGSARAAEQRRARHLLELCRRSGRPLTIAFSGGNDSAACLAFVVRRLAVRCTAVLADNGFTPAAVLERARRFCTSLGVPLTIVPFRLIDLLPQHPSDPCAACAPVVLALVSRQAVRERSLAVATGHLYGPGLSERPVAGTRMQVIAPLYLESVGETERESLLDGAGWTSALRYGNSSNCTLLGYVEHRYMATWGYSPAAAELSHEIRDGMVSRERALERLERVPLFLPEYRDVATRLARHAAGGAP